MGKTRLEGDVELTDDLLGIAKEIDPSLELQYNKHYIGIYKDGQPFNFCTFRPRKATVNISIKLGRSDEIQKRLDDSEIKQLSYTSWGSYRLSLQKNDISKHRDMLKQLMQAAYENRS